MWVYFFILSIYLMYKMKKTIRKILREEFLTQSHLLSIVESTNLQKDLENLMKNSGVIVASKAVGGIDRLSKILNIDMDDAKTQEMLVKNFIYHFKTEEVDISFLSIRKSKNGNTIIEINGTTNDQAANIGSWIVRYICDEANKFFPFNVSAIWEPYFANRNIKVFLDADIIRNTED